MTKGKAQDVGASVERLPHNEREAFVIKKYNDVVQSAELLDIRLTSSRFYVKSEYFAQRREQSTPYSNDAGFELEGSLKWSDYDAQHGILIGHFDWSASCKHKRRNLLSVTASYLIAYKLAKELDERYTHTFLKNVGRFAIFPYFRSLVSQYSAASSAELPILPVLKQRIAKSSSDEEDQ